MTKRHEQELTEREFEDFLEGRSGVARGYDRLRDVEPPPALDRAVLEHARAAASGSRRRPSFWSHWSSRLAVAAANQGLLERWLQFIQLPLTPEAKA